MFKTQHDFKKKLKKNQYRLIWDDYFFFDQQLLESANSIAGIVEWPKPRTTSWGVRSAKNKSASFQFFFIKKKKIFKLIWWIKDSIFFPMYVLHIGLSMEYKMKILAKLWFSVVLNVLMRAHTYAHVHLTEGEGFRPSSKKCSISLVTVSFSNRKWLIPKVALQQNWLPLSSCKKHHFLLGNFWY